MTVAGDDIIKNCRYCWSNHGYGIKLGEGQNGTLGCPHCKTKYRIHGGMLEKI